MDKDQSSITVMTAKEVSAFLKIPITTLYELVSRRKLRAAKCGRQWRFFESDVMDYLRSCLNLKGSCGRVNTERREYPRIKSEINVHLEGMLSSSRGVLNGRIRDISEGGLYLHDLAGNGPACAPEAGDPVKVEFDLREDDPRHLDIKARIVRVIKHGESGYAIKFRYLSGEDRQRIHAYVG